MAQRMSDDIDRELGRLSEAMENAKEDRLEMRRAVDKLSDFVQELRAEFRGLNQTMQSTANTIATLTADKCGARLDALEIKAKHYDRMLGTAATFLWKIVAALAISAAAGASAAKILEKFL